MGQAGKIIAAPVKQKIGPLILNAENTGLFLRV